MGGFIMRILVTGGAGYIGSHTCLALLEQGHEVVVFDNLYNASEEALNRVKKLTGKDLTFYKADMLDRDAMEKIFDAEKIDAVIHFAGLKAVGESVAKPWEYYHNNITGTLILLDVMRKHGVKKIIFSSSATVYGDPALCRSQRSARRDSAQTRTDRQRVCWSRSLPICRRQIRRECDPAPLLQSGGSS